MARATGALQERGDRSRRTELTDEIDVADVDTELERCCRDQHLELAVLETLLGLETQLLRHAAVMRHHVLGADELGEMTRGALGHPPRVDEDQRRAMTLRELGESRVDLLPYFVRHDGGERRARHFDLEIARSDVAAVDDRAIRADAD